MDFFSNPKKKTHEKKIKKSLLKYSFFDSLVNTFKINSKPYKSTVKLIDFFFDLKKKKGRKF